jgi:hypothetical protein
MKKYFQGFLALTIAMMFVGVSFAENPLPSLKPESKKVTLPAKTQKVAPAAKTGSRASDSDLSDTELEKIGNKAGSGGGSLSGPGGIIGGGSGNGNSGGGGSGPTETEIEKIGNNSGNDGNDNGNDGSTQDEQNGNTNGGNEGGGGGEANKSLLNRTKGVQPKSNVIPSVQPKSHVQ